MGGASERAAGEKNRTLSIIMKTGNIAPSNAPSGSGVRGPGRPRKIPLPVPLTKRQELEKRLVDSTCLLTDEELEKAVIHAEKIEDRRIKAWVANRCPHLQNAATHTPGANE